VILSVHGLTRAFGGLTVVDGVSLAVAAGSALGVVGPNGAGKTALLRTLGGSLDPAGGERWIGSGIEVGYLSQAAAGLPEEASVIDVLRAGRSMAEDTAVRRLMTFLFDYEQVRRPVRTLSGGERTRLAFLLLMEDAPNCLLLDEPTNHLDIESIEAVENALEHYDGTVVAVSHDRYFLDRIADRIVVVSDGAAHAYEGGWSENLARV
jgi:ATP-binding cassette subfamily F protein 3